MSVYRDYCKAGFAEGAEACRTTSGSAPQQGNPPLCPGLSLIQSARFHESVADRLHHVRNIIDQFLSNVKHAFIEVVGKIVSTSRPVLRSSMMVTDGSHGTTAADAFRHQDLFARGHILQDDILADLQADDFGGLSEIEFGRRTGDDADRRGRIAAFEIGKFLDRRIHGDDG